MSNDPTIQVIIVNDNPDIGQIWQELINMNSDIECVGYALDGYEAIEMTEDYAPDVILMDFMMPGIDGLEATERVLEICSDTLVIIFSAYTRVEGIDEKACKAGAVDILPMPVTPEVLFDTIRHIYIEYSNICPFT